MEAPSPTTTPPPAPPRVVLFGDSQADSLEYTLVRDTGAFGYPVAFQRVGRIGCGIIGGYADVGAGSGLNENCERWRTELPAVVHDFDPDVVLVMIGAWEVYDTVVGDTRLVPGTPEYAAQLSSQLRDAVAIASAGGAQVVLLDVACYPVPDLGVAGQDRVRAEAWRGHAVTDVIHSVADELDLTVLPYHDLLCDGDEPRPLFDVVVRPDGVHFPQENDCLLYTSPSPRD